MTEAAPPFTRGGGRRLRHKYTGSDSYKRSRTRIERTSTGLPRVVRTANDGSVRAQRGSRGRGRGHGNLTQHLRRRTRTRRSISRLKKILRTRPRKRKRNPMVELGLTLPRRTGRVLEGGARHRTLVSCIVSSLICPTACQILKQRERGPLRKVQWMTLSFQNDWRHAITMGWDVYGHGPRFERYRRERENTCRIWSCAWGRITPLWMPLLQLRLQIPGHQTR